MIDTFMVQIAHDTRFPDPGTVGGYIVASLTLLFVRLICTSNICAASQASDRQHRSTHSFLPSLCSLILNGHRRSSREGLVHCPAASAGLTDGFVPALVPTCFPWSKDALIRSILTASAQTVRESVHITAIQRHASTPALTTFPYPSPPPISSSPSEPNQHRQSW